MQVLEAFPDLTGVIVADDDGVIRDVLRSKLEAINQTVLLACDGQEAVDLASRMRAKLIMLDVKMPRMNGLLACQQIREMPHNTRTPIVILTSMIGNETELAAARIGATAFLTKPFRSAELLQALANFLSMSETMRDVISRAADRAGVIARAAPEPNGIMSVLPVAPNDAFSRGKEILRVLRR
jgi:CheY-like chemotaxis protein